MKNTGIFESYADKISRFIKNKENSNYILNSYEKNNVLEDTVYLRQTLFQNLILAYASINDYDEIEDLMLVAIPGLDEENLFVQIIYFTNKTHDFFKEALNYFKNICKDEGFTKIRINLSDDDLTIFELINEFEFIEEVQFIGENNTYTQYALFIDKLSKLKSMNISQYVPTIKNTYFANYKVDKGDLVLYSSLLPSFPYRLNTTASCIFKMVEEEKNLLDIVEKISLKYKYFNYEKIFNDVLYTLRGLWEYGYIHWVNNKYPYSDLKMEYGDYTFKNYSYEDIGDFYNIKDSLYIENPYISHRINISIDQLWLNNILKREKMFALIKNNTTLLSLSMTYDHNTESYSICNFIINKNENISKEIISKFIDFCKNNISSILNINRELSKQAKVYIYVNADNEDFISILKSLGFKYDLTLYLETKTGNVNLYSLQ